MPVLMNLVEHVSGHHAHDPLGEVDDLGPSVDEHEPDGGEGIERTRAEANHGEAKDVIHALTPRQTEWSAGLGFGEVRVHPTPRP